MIKKSDLKLVRFDDPILYTPPAPFDFNGSQDAEMLANMMIERMQELGGIGLSANQVGLNIRMFVMGVHDVKLAIFNPVIERVSDSVISVDEGCLTYPGVYLKVSRPQNVFVSFQNIKGETVKEMFNGLSARIFLHEYDHMEGKTFKDRVSKMKWDLAYNRMIKRTKKIIRMNVQKKLLNIKKQTEQNVNNS